MISFDLPEARFVELSISDVSGRRIATLVDGSLPSGRHSVRWDAGNLPSGIYLYRLAAEDFVQSKQMLLVK